MMRRTIAEAKAEFERSVLPHLSDYHAQRARRMIGEAEAEARVRAKERIDSLEGQVLHLRDEALRELTEVRDEFDDLASEGQDARIGAADFARRMAELRSQQVQAEERLGRADGTVDEIADIEADPLAWFDQLSTRLPHLQRDWGW